MILLLCAIPLSQADYLPLAIVYLKLISGRKKPRLPPIAAVRMAAFDVIKPVVK
jgi:hypothetical protein